MRENLSLIDAFNQDQDTSPERGSNPWAVMTLALGGALTFALVGFLLWVAFQFLDWAFG